MLHLNIRLPHMKHFFKMLYYTTKYRGYPYTNILLFICVVVSVDKI